MNAQQIIENEKAKHEFLVDALAGASANAVARLETYLRELEYRVNPCEQTWWNSLVAELRDPLLKI